MFTIPKISFLFLLLYLLGHTFHASRQMADAKGPAAPAPLELARWQPHDFSFTAPVPAHENPFLISFSAVLKGPGGIRLEIPGFYDGDNQWKIRASPTALGQWTLTTVSSYSGLAGLHSEFACVLRSDVYPHSPLQVDPAHPQHFVYADDSHCFLQSYECDWLWALGLGRDGAGVTERFLDKLCSYGFNEVIFNAVAYDTKWKPGTTAEDDYGPPPLEAWQGSHKSPDFNRFNLAYWQHFDHVIAALLARGMQAHVMIKVYNKRVNWPAPGSPEDDLYFRWLISRYSACPNITWDLTKEGYNLKSLGYKLDRLHYLRTHDPYRRLLTIHDDDGPTLAGTYDGVIDFLTDQQHHQFGATIRSQHARHAWPVLNAESCYEWGPGGATDKSGPDVNSPREVAAAAWDIAMAGGYATYNYTHTAWDIIRPDDTPPGFVFFSHLGSFFRSTRYWTLQPAENLTDKPAACLANRGHEYIVYQPVAKTFTLHIEGADKPLAARWYQPSTGKFASAANAGNGNTAFTPPATWSSDAVVLHVSNQSWPAIAHESDLSRLEPPPSASAIR